MDVRVSGVVVWFNPTKGFGFIKPDSGGKDLFAHYSNIVMEGYKELKADQRVTFEVSEILGKGYHAINIQLENSGV